MVLNYRQLGQLSWPAPGLRHLTEVRGTSLGAALGARVTRCQQVATAISHSRLPSSRIGRPSALAGRMRGRNFAISSRGSLSALVSDCCLRERILASAGSAPLRRGGPHRVVTAEDTIHGGVILTWANPTVRRMPPVLDGGHRSGGGAGAPFGLGAQCCRDSYGPHIIPNAGLECRPVVGLVVVPAAAQRHASREVRGSAAPGAATGTGVPRRRSPRSSDA